MTLLLRSSFECPAGSRELADRLLRERVVVREGASRGDIELICGPEGLTLASAGQPGQGLSLRLDLASGPLGYRRARAARSREDLVRALGGLPQGSTVIDASAGLGRDSLILASSGLNVVALERHPVLSVLLADALRRAARHEALQPVLSRIRLEEHDARAWLAQHDTPFDAAVFDPMFPPRRKGAAVKKEMQILQRLLGDDADPDAAETLVLLRQRVRRRVVVKRPLHAPWLGDVEPSHALRGRSTRFDIYLPTLHRAAETSS